MPKESCYSHLVSLDPTQINRILSFKVNAYRLYLCLFLEFYAIIKKSLRKKPMKDVKLKLR